MDVRSSALQLSTGIASPSSTDITPFSSTSVHSILHSTNHTHHTTHFIPHRPAWTAVHHPTYLPHPNSDPQRQLDPHHRSHHQIAIAITFGVLGCLAMAMFAFG